MQNCISYLSLAPVRYVSELRNTQKASWTMKDTKLYPAFPIASVLGWLSILGFSAYMIAYFITTNDEPCYDHIRIGIIILSVIYPIEATCFFICAVGSAALSSTDCWKILVILFFGILVSGFSFGGLGFPYLCTLGAEHPLLINVGFLFSNTFIQIIVYTYLGFLILYFVLLPLLTCAYSGQKKPQEEQEGRGCCSIFCCIIYYFFQIIFLIAGIFMICLKILGVPLLIYVLNQIFRSTQIQSYSWFIALTIISFTLPITVFCIIYIISNCLNLNDSPSQKEQIKQIDILDPSKQKQVQFLATQPSKGFEDDNYKIDNDKL